MHEDSSRQLAPRKTRQVLGGNAQMRNNVTEALLINFYEENMILKV